MSPQHVSEIRREVRAVAKSLGITIDIPREGDEYIL